MKTTYNIHIDYTYTGRYIYRLLHIPVVTYTFSSQNPPRRLTNRRQNFWKNRPSSLLLLTRQFVKLGPMILNNAEVESFFFIGDF